MNFLLDGRVGAAKSDDWLKVQGLGWSGLGREALLTSRAGLLASLALAPPTLLAPL